MVGQKGSPRFGEAGIAQILVVLILILGLFGGLSLVQQTQVFKPRAQGPVSAPIAPPFACNERIESFSISEPCDEVHNGFRTAQFTCSIEINLDEDEVGKQGGQRNCRSAEEWLGLAISSCSRLCPKPPLPSPIPQPPPFWPPFTSYCTTTNEYYPFWQECPSPTPTPQPVPVSCGQFDGDIKGCDQIPGCAYYFCSNTCWPSGTSDEAACKPDQVQ